MHVSCKEMILGLMALANAPWRTDVEIDLAGGSSVCLTRGQHEKAIATLAVARGNCMSVPILERETKAMSKRRKEFSPIRDLHPQVLRASTKTRRGRLNGSLGRQSENSDI